MKPFEIFRTGRHTSMQGSALTFSDADLGAIAAGYDAKLHHAPIVVGHPKQDAPAYGWVDGLEVKNGRLVAKPGAIDTAFSDLVKDGKFRKVSAAFYQPESANNPTPGAYYLRHVGFLGAAAPAVKGLKEVEFADEDTLVVEFAEGDYRLSWALDAVSRLFRGIREHFISADDLETADRLVPEYELNSLQQTAAEIRANADTEMRPAFGDAPVVPAPNAATPKGPDMTEQQQAANTALDERERQLTEREAAFSDREREGRDKEDAAFVTGVVAAGRLPAGLQATATALFSDLDEGELTFSESGAEQKTTPREAFRKLLDGLPVPVQGGEIATDDATADFSDPKQVAAAIETEIADASKKGEVLSPSQAAARLKLRS